jgi:hypothetical protein
LFFNPAAMAMAPAAAIPFCHNLMSSRSVRHWGTGKNFRTVERCDLAAWL